MNVLHRIVRKTLALNPTRTWVTIIGIVLSMALLTAVIEGAYSGLVYMRGVTTEDTGDWHGYFWGLDDSTAQSVKEQEFVKDVVTTWRLVGYEAQEPEAERQPVFVDALEGDSPLIASRIKEGRMPENEHEIILSSNFYGIAKQNALDAFEVGQTVTLSIGDRISPDGEPLSEHDSMWAGETVVDAKPVTYTIVGIYRSFDPSVQGTGYRALTKGQGTGACSVFFTVKHPYFFKSVMNRQTVSEHWRKNASLMRLYGVFNDDVIISVLYGFTAVLVVLVMFGSISLIYNAFSISVSERTRQFGILKSIGATKKQIRASVRYEALMLSAIGIPAGLIVGCAGIGITLWAIRDSISALMPNAETQMRLALHPIALLIAAMIALITVLISAAVPARRAARLQPIDAIRQSADVKTKAKEVRTSKLTEKLFGFEGTMGAKNFKRNKKGYRATVLSLFMSVVLFISASSFCAYLTDMVRTVAESSNVDVFAYVPTAYAEEIFQEVRTYDGVTRAGYYRMYYGYSILADPELLTDEALKLLNTSFAGSMTDINAALLYLDDDSFRALCRQNGLDPEPYFREDCPYGVLMNSDITVARMENNRIRYYRYDLFKNHVLSATLVVEEIEEREGCERVFVDDAEWEEVRVAYYPKAYYEQQRRDDYGVYSEDLDPAKAEAIVPMSEALITEPHSFDAFVQSDDFCIRTDCASLIYPFSKLPEKLKSESEDVQMLFQTTDHKALTEAFLKLFSESEFRYNAYAGDLAEDRENSRMIVGVVNVFAYGFIILISLIAVANVFNTISTNVLLRRREFAMLKSIGLSERGMSRMLRFECIIYGVKGLVWGLPASILVTFLIWNIMSEAVEQGFYVPWHSVLIAVGSVFAVVFATMLYAKQRIRRDNPIDALKNENL
ncbi:MAG: ABC transporter permease [Clostridia bacterium]|nr:ABC transporter permease [Clostridia bacterium]